MPFVHLPGAVVRKSTTTLFQIHTLIHAGAGMSSHLTRSAEASTSAAVPARSDRDGAQADPLPRKVGELGYDPTIHAAPSPPDGSSSSETIPLRPHPAERSTDPTHRDDSTAITALTPPRSRAMEHTHSRTDTSTTVSSSEHPHSTSQQDLQLAGPAQSSTSLAPSAASMSSIKRFTKKFKPSPEPSKHFFGLAPRTLLKFFILFFFLGGLCACWALATKANAAGHGSLFGGSSAGGMNVVVFVHVAFAVIVLTTLLFIERTLFRLRAERFSYLHPELGLPTRNPRFPGNSNLPGLAFAPWQRPPLPTYAAALRAAPTATGDVEDQEVARMVAIGRGDVPPLYGNTRGSTLLAYGFGAGPLANRPISSSSRATRVGAEDDESGSRPVSYGQSQQIEDALRAQKLEETLSRLEVGR